MPRAQPAQEARAPEVPQAERGQGRGVAFNLGSTSLGSQPHSTRVPQAPRCLSLRRATTLTRVGDPRGKLPSLELLELGEQGWTFEFRLLCRQGGNDCVQGQVRLRPTGWPHGRRAAHEDKASSRASMQ